MLPLAKLVQQDLTDTLATLDKIDRIKEETVQLRQKVAEAPEKMRQATAALTALSDVDNDEETRKIPEGGGYQDLTLPRREWDGEGGALTCRRW